ncbi:MAG: ImmA/IrrE family metallo-endopeptidase [Firmicutes bacterium]|nr:ImmA/IrrE family metallo-endopeptidase [Bacillota bacterium]
MSSVERIQIKEEILHWVIQESQKESEEIINKFPKVVGWIKGDIKPTFKQLQDFANFLKVPFGYLFLREPPKINIMEAEFRTINNKLPYMSKNLKDTITSMDIRRSWMSDYRKDLGWEKLNIIKEFNDKKNGLIKEDIILAKSLLELEEEWYEKIKSYGDAYNFLKTKLEAQGILIMQNGIVEYNTRRKLDINEFRAFMLYDDIAPVIFINNNDSLGGKIFSLIHELFHVLHEQEDLFLEGDIYSTKKDERYMNQLTVEFLMPENYIKEKWNENNDPFEQIQSMASFFKVSETALAIKLKELMLIEEDTLKNIIEIGIKYFDKKTNESGASGGDFYNTFNTRVSPTFTKAVIRSTEAGDIEYTYAFRLLGGIKGKTYDEIKERILPYG